MLKLKAQVHQGRLKLDEPYDVSSNVATVSGSIDRGRHRARPRSTLLKVEAPGVEHGSGDVAGECRSE